MIHLGPPESKMIHGHEIPLQLHIFENITKYIHPDQRPTSLEDDS